MNYLIVGIVCSILGSLVGVGAVFIIFTRSNKEYHVESVDKTKEEELEK